MRRFRPQSRVVRLLAVAGIATGLLASQGCIKSPLAHPDLKPFQRYLQPDTTADLTVRFMGTSSLLFTVRDTSILMDGFVSRPHWLQVGVLGIKPNCERIASARDSLGDPTITAVFTGHAHYDHAMDAPVWAQHHRAALIGSQSVKMLGLGIGLPDSQTIVVREGSPIQVGEFELTFIESVHGRPDRFPGTVNDSLWPQAKTKRWATGLVYSVFVRHRGRTILVQSTAGFKPGALRGRHADVVYLAVGGLGELSFAAIDAYWNEVVRATGARRVILVHWDDFFRGLDDSIQGNMYGGDDVPRAIGRIVERAVSDSVDVWMPRIWRPTDPFRDLPLPTAPAAIDPDRKAVRLYPASLDPYCPANPAAEAVRSRVRGGR